MIKIHIPYGCHEHNVWHVENIQNILTDTAITIKVNVYLYYPYSYSLELAFYSNDQIYSISLLLDGCCI